MNAATTRAAGSPPTAMVLIAFACVYLIWGSTYLAIRFAIESMPPFLMVSVRYLLAGALLYAWVVLRGEAVRATAAQWRAAFFFGGLFFLVGNGGVSWAELRIPSGITALLVAMVPLWMALLEWLRRRDQRPSLQVIVGLLVGFLGVAFLIGPGESLTKSAIDPLAAGAMVLTTLGWAYGSIHARNAPHPPSLLQSAAMQMLAGAVLSGLMGTLLGEWRSVDLSSISGRSALAFAYLVVFGSIVAFTAYTYLLRAVRPARVGTYAFVNPIVAVFLGWALGGEPVTGRTLVAGAVIVAGVILILRARSRLLGDDQPTRPGAIRRGDLQEVEARS